MSEKEDRRPRRNQAIRQQARSKPDFKKRFGGPVKRSGPTTNVVGMLLAERDESL